MQPEDPRRRLLVNSLAAGVAASLLPEVAAGEEVAYSQQAVRLPAGQSVFRIRGEAYVNDQPATLQTQIGPNDRVRTGPASELIFVVGGHAMLIRDNTNLIMRGREAEASNPLVSALRLITGKLLAVSRRQRTIYSTSTATIGIRGTGVYIEAEPDLTYFCTCYGKTTVRAVHDSSSRAYIDSKHHDHPMMISRDGKAGHRISKAGFRAHTDEELLLIETLVGRTTPFPVPFDGPDPYAS